MGAEPLSEHPASSYAPSSLAVPVSQSPMRGHACSDLSIYETASEGTQYRASTTQDRASTKMHANAVDSDKIAAAGDGIGDPNQNKEAADSNSRPRTEVGTDKEDGYRGNSSWENARWEKVGLRSTLIEADGDEPMSVEAENEAARVGDYYRPEADEEHEESWQLANENEVIGCRQVR